MVATVFIRLFLVTVTSIISLTLEQDSQLPRRDLHPRGQAYEDYMFHQQDEGGQSRENEYEFYYVQKRRDCQEYLRRYPEKPYPAECTVCADEYPAEICDSWVRNGACIANGSIAIQVCAASCGTCQAMSSYPALFLVCRDKPWYSCANHDIVCDSLEGRRHCPETCKLCKDEVTSAYDMWLDNPPVKYVNKPSACTRDIMFSQLTKTQQYALACGCWGFQINAYARCCGTVQYYSPEWYWCYKMPNDSPQFGRGYQPPQKRCCEDRHCDEGYGCAYGSTGYARDDWDMRWRDPTNFFGFRCTGYCVKGLKVKWPSQSQ